MWTRHDKLLSISSLERRREEIRVPLYQCLHGGLNDRDLSRSHEQGILHSQIFAERLAGLKHLFSLIGG